MKRKVKGLEQFLREGKTLLLTTKGRKTGKPHRVELAFVFLNERLYVGSDEPITKKDWFRNILKNDEVVVEIGGSREKGRARPVYAREKVLGIIREFSRKYLFTFPKGVEEGGITFPKVEIELLGRADTTSPQRSGSKRRSGTLQNGGSMN